MNRDYNRESCGRRMRIIRKAKGLTQHELAALSGLDGKAVSRFENGRTEMQIGNLIRIADVLDVSMEYLLFGKVDAIEVNELLKMLPGDKREKIENGFCQILKAIL